MIKTTFWPLAIFIFGLFSTFSCSHFYKKACCGKKKNKVAGKAIVKAVDGSDIKGEVIFEPLERYKFKVSAKFEGLKANGTWGFHVHEFGICEGKGLMAGAHFNPRGQKHGGPQGKKRHWGDLGNLKSDAKGQVDQSFKATGKLKKFLGRSVILHARPDDLKSQPTGNSGKRLACGVIRAVPPFKTEGKVGKKAIKHAPSHFSIEEKSSSGLVERASLKVESPAPSSEAPVENQPIEAKSPEPPAQEDPVEEEAPEGGNPAPASPGKAN